MTSDTIVRLLRAKHSKDLILPECLTGAAQSSRLDAWVMQKSWSHPVTTGYEIKVSRSDFLRDDKWQGYLEYCTDFYFVCPSGLIQPEEIASPAGLMWVAKTGNRLLTKKKSARRSVKIPERFWRSVIMRQHGWNHQEPNADFWRSWLANKNAELDVGHRVSRKLKQLLREKIHTVECENIRLKAENEKLKPVADILKELGVRPSSYNLKGDIRRRTQQAFDDAFISNLKYMRDSADRLLSIKVCLEEQEDAGV